MTSMADFQANTDECIHLDSRKSYSSKYCRDHLFKLLTVCCYALTIL